MTDNLDASGTGSDDPLAIPDFLKRTDNAPTAGGAHVNGGMFAPLAPQETKGAEPVRRASDDFQPITPVPLDAPAAAFHDWRYGEPSHVFAYRDESGQTLFYVRRFAGGPKAIPLAYCEAPDGTRQWRAKWPGAPRSLYNVDQIAKRPEAPVLIVEGEKTAEAAQAMFPDHIVATTSGGAKAAHLANFEPLSGRIVRLWPDHDREGEEYSLNAKRLAEKAGARCAIVQVPAEFPQKWDLADAPPPAFSVETLRAMAFAATPLGPDLAPAVPVPLANNLGSDTEIDRLACMSSLDYERTRKDHAERLRIRPGALDKLVKDRRRKLGTDRNEPRGQGRPLDLPTPEPSAEPVDGTWLLDELSAIFRRYLALPDGAADAMALWVTFAHAIGAFHCSPRLFFKSPEKRCGKSTALLIVSRLVPRPLISANITSSALFRTVEVAAPTLIVDEGDTFIAKSDELSGILNSGHTRALAYVIRNVGDDHEPRKFLTWCALAIAAIGGLPDTLEDRSIIVTMRRRRPDEKVERLRSDRTGHLSELASKAARWAMDSEVALSAADPGTPAELNDRAADNWRVLLAIADHAGGDWPQKARKAAILLSGSGNDDADSNRTKLLADIQTIFGRTGGGWISSTELLANLFTLEDRPWADYRNGKAINVNGLASLLRPYGIRPKVTRDGAATLRGYHREDFEDAFCRYLGGTPETPKHLREISAVEHGGAETSAQAVTPGAPPSALKEMNCYDVAAQSPDQAGCSPVPPSNSSPRWRTRI